MGFLAGYDEGHRSFTRTSQSPKITALCSGSNERALAPLASVTGYYEFHYYMTTGTQVRACGDKQPQRYDRVRKIEKTHQKEENVNWLKRLHTYCYICHEMPEKNKEKSETLKLWLQQHAE